MPEAVSVVGVAGVPGTVEDVRVEARSCSRRIHWTRSRGLAIGRPCTMVGQGAEAESRAEP